MTIVAEASQGFGGTLPGAAARSRVAAGRDAGGSPGSGGLRGGAGLGLVCDLLFRPESLRGVLELGVVVVKVPTTGFFNDTLIGAALGRAPQVFLSARGTQEDYVST